MKVRVIGSGSMWCANNSACYLIDEDIMVDFPNGACKYLYKFGIQPKDINYVLLTHFHGDHYFDIPFYILNKSRYSSKNTNIFCSKEGKKKIYSITKLAFPNSYRNAITECNLQFNFDEAFKINDYEVKRILLDHGRMKPVYGYIITNMDNVSIGFTGDTSLCDNVEIMASSCKYLFCDCMLVSGDRQHQGIDNIKYLSKKYPDCQFVVSHLQEETRKILLKSKIVNVIVPVDGDLISISS